MKWWMGSWIYSVFPGQNEEGHGPRPLDATGAGVAGARLELYGPGRQAVILPGPGLLAPPGSVNRLARGYLQS